MLQGRKGVSVQGQLWGLGRGQQHGQRRMEGAADDYTWGWMVTVRPSESWARQAQDQLYLFEPFAIADFTGHKKLSIFDF